VRSSLQMTDERGDRFLRTRTSPEFRRSPSSRALRASLGVTRRAGRAGLGGGGCSGVANDRQATWSWQSFRVD
jgi:hypothetical protein